MNILVIHQYYLAPGQPGGSRFNEFARIWRSAGHDVTVIAGTVNYATGEALDDVYGWTQVRDEDGVRVVRCHVPSSYNRSYLGRMWAFFGFTLTATLGAINAPRPDAIIATSPPLTTAISGWIASIRHRAPWIFEIRDLWPESAVTTGVLSEKGLLTRLLYRLERFACLRATAITVLTPAFADDLERRRLAGREKVSFVPNGADLDAFAPGPRQNEQRGRLQWGNRFVALYAGAHGRANGLMQLVDAAEALRGERDVLIASVGDGPERLACQRAAQSRGLDNIQFLGPVPKAHVPALIRAADAGLAVLQNNPTFRTVYPNKVFDYMACERPIIVGIDGIARDLVCDQAEAGLFAAPENGAAIAEAIRRLRDDSALCARLGRNGRAWAIRNADRCALAARYVSVLESIAPQCTVPAPSASLTSR